MNNALTPQAETLLAHLKAGGTLTNRSAHIDFAVGSLTKRISELRAAGYDVHGAWHTNHKTGQRFMRYSMGESAQVAPPVEPKEETINRLPKMEKGQVALFDLSKEHPFVLIQEEINGDLVEAEYLEDDYDGDALFFIRNYNGPGVLHQCHPYESDTYSAFVGIKREAPKKEFDKYVVVAVGDIKKGDKLMLLKADGKDIANFVGESHAGELCVSVIEYARDQHGRFLCTALLDAASREDGKGYDLACTFNGLPQFMTYFNDEDNYTFARLENAR